MLLRAVEYVRPDSPVEAIAALRSSRHARVLAGGQSLVNVLKHRVAACELLVDISRIDELRFIDAGQDGSVRIGAATTYDELDRSSQLRASHPRVAEVASGTVDQQVRCRGTIGGNACYNDPASNFPPLLVALGATMRIESADGPREVAAEDFFFAPFETAVGTGELLHSIVLPPLSGRGVGHSSILLAQDSWALARACAVIEANGVVQDVRLVLGCVGPAPVRARAVEDRLRGAQLSAGAIEAAVPAAREGLTPVSDVHASAEYRLEMAVVVAQRALLQAAEHLSA
ncbi:MAG: xanthine dehydrogenase family protein subunit M [Actinomycetota bacterium]|nr:xanthine dehydrogenase family protein subunit M [Actinomycetota bacterium]